MRKIERKIYKFEELDKDIQEKLIEEERESQQEVYCDCYLYDDMEEKASDLINDYFGITSDYLKVYYDLSYSQGSGAMVEFDINIEDLNNKYKIFSDEEIKFLIQKDVIDYIKIRQNGYYYHEYSFKIDCFYYNDWEFDDIKEDYNITEKEFNTIEDRFYELIDMCNKNGSEFIKDIISMNKELGKYGYGCLEYYWNCDDSEIIQFLNENEYYKNGSVYMGEE